MYSSIGKPKSEKPDRYLLLNPQTPTSVNQISHGIKTKNINKKPRRNDLKFSWNFNLLWKVYIMGTINENPRINRYKYLSIIKSN